MLQVLSRSQTRAAGEQPTLAGSTDQEAAATNIHRSSTLTVWPSSGGVIVKLIVLPTTGGCREQPASTPAVIAPFVKQRLTTKPTL
jgi:hypothetical protein